MTEKEAIKVLEGLAVPVHAEPAFDMAIDALEKIRPKFHLKCLRCGGDVGCYSDITMEQVGYTNYSYCEKCLREGLAMLKAHPDEMTEDTAEAIEIIRPIAKELGINVSASEGFMYMNGQRIGIECNSTYATLMEMIGYIFLMKYPRFRKVKINKKLAGAIMRYWYQKAEEGIEGGDRRGQMTLNHIYDVPKACRKDEDKPIFPTFVSGRVPRNEVFIVDDVCKEIDKRLQSERNEQRWIPCTERLPEEDGWYLTTYDGDICDREGEVLVGMTEFESGKWEEDTVYAWMPLPEPWKRGKS